MKELETGQWLLSLRKRAGLSAADIANRTKIAPGSLTALEEGHFGSLPTPAHLRAFVLAYAKACGASEEEILPHLALLSRQLPGAVKAVEPKVARAPFALQGKVWGLRALVAAGVLFCILGSVLLVPSFRRPAGEQASPQASAEAVSAQPLSATATDGQAAVAELSLRAKRECWVVLQIDGIRLPTVILEPDKRERWRVRSRAVMLAGNAGAVRVWWQGENLGYLGELGQRVNGLVFEAGQPWKKDPGQDLALPPGVPSKGGVN